MDAILKRYGAQLAAVTLRPGADGVFDISMNDKLLFSKHQANRFPEVDEVIRLVGEQLNQ